MANRAAVAVGLLVAGVLAAGARASCGLTWHEFSDDRTEEASITEIRLDGGSGSLTVQPGEGQQVHVHRTVRYGGDKPGATDHADGSVLLVKTGCGMNCGVDYTITMPAGVRVNGHNGSGDINLRGVSTVSLDVGSGNVVVHEATGAVVARTGSGDVELTDVKADVTARTGSGNVKLARITGTVVTSTSSGDLVASDLTGPQITARTGSGNVTLSLGVPQGVFAETGSGDVNVKVPTGSYKVTTRTGSGDTSVRIPTDPNGTYLLDLHTGSGNITVDQR
jgi:hypothetical protein